MDLLLDAVHYPIVTIAVSGVLSLELARVHAVLARPHGEAVAEKVLEAYDTTEFDRCARSKRIVIA
jgi:hypothetical protein